MLFAETSPETWIGVVGSLVGALSTFGMGYLAYLGNKNQDRIVALEKGAAECEENLKAARDELKARDEKDRAELQRQINDLRGQLAAKKDRTDGHEPLDGGK